MDTYPFETKGVSALSLAHFSSLAESIRQVIKQDGEFIKIEGQEVATSNPGWLDAAIFVNEFYLSDQFKQAPDLVEVVVKLLTYTERHSRCLTLCLQCKAYESDPSLDREVLLEHLESTLGLVNNFREFLGISK